MQFSEADEITGNYLYQGEWVPKEEFFKRIGALGGTRTRETRGSDHFSQAGKKGGQTLRESRGPDYFREIAKLPRRPRGTGYKAQRAASRKSV